MSRSRGRKPDTSPASLGVGGLAGSLPHGAGGVVRSLTATGGTASAAAPPSPGAVPAQDPATVPTQSLAPGGADVDLFSPTARPWEPMTAGLAQPSVPQPDPDILLLAPMLPALEMRAAQPNASAAMRNLVRRLRSRIPADFDFSQILDRQGGN